MHLELVVPSLFAAPDLPSGSTPAIDLLLARSRRSDAARAGLESWLGQAFALEGAGARGTTFPAGALTAYAHGLDADRGTWLRADPVHLRADRDRVQLLPGTAMAIAAAEAEALSAALAPLLAGTFSLHVVAPDQWCLRVHGDVAENACGDAPADLAGANIGAHLPPRSWHRLLTEIQMTLYGHGANTVREQRGEPAVNSVWLWGAGKLPAAARGPWHSVSAVDALAAGLARLAGIRHRPPGDSAAAWLDRAPEDGRHLIALDGLRGARAIADHGALVARWRSLEENWFAPLLSALKAGRIGMLTIHVPDAGASFESTRADLNRFWRRRRPLPAYGALPE